MLRQGSPIDEQAMQGYFDFHEVPEEKRQDATAKGIRKVARKLSASERTIRERTERRERAERAWRGLIGGDVSLRAYPAKGCRGCKEVRR